MYPKARSMEHGHKKYSDQTQSFKVQFYLAFQDDVIYTAMTIFQSIFFFSLLLQPLFLMSSSLRD